MYTLLYLYYADKYLLHHTYLSGHRKPLALVPDPRDVILTPEFEFACKLTKRAHLGSKSAASDCNESKQRARVSSPKSSFLNLEFLRALPAVSSISFQSGERSSPMSTHTRQRDNGISLRAVSITRLQTRRSVVGRRDAAPRDSAASGISGRLRERSGAPRRAAVARGARAVSLSSLRILGATGAKAASRAHCKRWRGWSTAKTRFAFRSAPP